MNRTTLAIAAVLALLGSAPAMSAETPASSCGARLWRLVVTSSEEDTAAQQAEMAIREAMRMARFPDPNYLIVLSEIKEAASKANRIVAFAEQTIAGIDEFQKACPNDFKESERSFWSRKTEMDIFLRLYKEP